MHNTRLTVNDFVNATSSCLKSALVYASDKEGNIYGISFKHKEEAELVLTVKSEAVTLKQLTAYLHKSYLQTAIKINSGSIKVVKLLCDIAIIKT